jgi:pimeloyl-ACP methyl ester carboxylesterase
LGHAPYVFVTTEDGVELWWQLEGTGPTVLLVPGRGDPTDLFPAEFSDDLIARGLSVLRWDPRDTGLSGAGGDTYTVATIAEDSIAVLDAARVEAAHVVGISMAGLVLAHLASRHADRVRSLTFIAAMSPDPDAGMGEDFFGAVDLDPTDRVAGLVRAMGETTEADRQWAAAAIEAGEARAAHRPDAVVRHQDAAFRLDWPTVASFRSVDVPTLVFHGRLDRVLPVAHAETIGAGIVAASVTIVDGMGHIPRLGDWLMISERVASETA